MKTEFTSHNGVLTLTLKPENNNERAMFDVMVLKERMMQVIKPRFAVRANYSGKGVVESISIKNERFINRRVLNAYGFMPISKVFVKTAPHQNKCYVVWGRGSYRVWEYDNLLTLPTGKNHYQWRFLKERTGIFLEIFNVQSGAAYNTFYFDFSDSKIINTVADLEELVSRQPKKKQ